jgi:hypothetical protein
MSAPPRTNPSSNYGSPQDWAQIISSAGQGASSAMQGATAYATSKKEAKEAKRRTLANLLSQATKRNQQLEHAGQQYSSDLKDARSQAMQEMARGFINSLSGSTR